MSERTQSISSKMEYPENIPEKKLLFFPQFNASDFCSRIPKSQVLERLWVGWLQISLCLGYLDFMELPCCVHLSSLSPAHPSPSLVATPPWNDFLRNHHEVLLCWSSQRLSCWVMGKKGPLKQKL